MFFRHGYDKLLYPTIAVALLIMSSYRPVYHLRTDMPSAFSASEPNPRERSVEQRIAWAYWESAQMNIQWKYPYGHPLPTDPPPEFRVDAQALGPKASDAATRQFYWHKLDQVWYSPDSWTRHYGWNFGWASDPLTSAAQWLRDETGRLFSR
jgi:hypothetical protein